MTKRISLLVLVAVYTALAGTGCATRHAAPITLQGPVAGPQHAEWDGHVWSCPAGTYVYVDEVAARAAFQVNDYEDPHNFVYCVPVREVEE